MMTRSLIIALLLIPALASANAGKRTTEATATGEPMGLIDIAIVREDLAIDLSGVTKAAVAVTYELDNRGESKRLSLIFASGARLLEGFTVTLDRVELPSRMLAADLPQSWQPPAATPRPGGGELPYDVERGVAIQLLSAAFELDVPPGKHQLAVRYRAATSTHSAGEPMLLHQFAYVLAPARTWASFGQLAISVRLPVGWEAEITPALERDGDTRKGTFTGVPADAVAITFSSPAGSYRLLEVLGLVAFVLAIAGGGLGVWRILSARGRRHAREGYLGNDSFVAFALAVVWAAAIIAGGWFAIFGADLALISGEVDHRGFGAGFQMLGVVALGLVALVAGALLGRVASRRGLRELGAVPRG